jgi:serine O-acetyltransferase
MKYLKIFKALFLIPILIYAYVLKYISKNKYKIQLDLQSYKKQGFYGLAYMIIFNREFRNILYFRLGLSSLLIEFFYNKNPTLYIMTKKIDGGLIVVHGDSTFINAKSIGLNFYVNQNVTVGVIGKHAPNNW